MDTTILSVLIGGVIGIVASLLSVLITHRFQSQESDKNRKWNIEDQKREKQQIILFESIDNIKTLIIDIYDSANNLFDNIENFSSPSIKQSVFNSLLKKTRTLRVMADVLGNEGVSLNISVFTIGVLQIVKSTYGFEIEKVDDPTREKFFSDQAGSLMKLDDPIKAVLRMLENIKRDGVS